MLHQFKDVTDHSPEALQRFRERFEASVQDHPQRTQKGLRAMSIAFLLWIPAGVAFILGAGLLTWALYLTLAGLIVYAMRTLPRLPQCPACDGDLNTLMGRFCPECGGRLFRTPQGPWRRHCAGCGKQLMLGRRRTNFTICACNRCGVILSDRPACAAPAAAGTPTVLRSSLGRPLGPLPAVFTWWFRLFALPFLLSGGVHAGLSSQALMEGLDSRAWPTVRATVVSNDLRRTRRARGRYTPELRYQYMVGDNTYTGTRLWIVAQDAPEADARAMLSQREPGQEVMARVNPHEPGASVLIPGTSLGTWIWIALAWSHLVVGIALTWAAWKPASSSNLNEIKASARSSA